MTKSLIDPLSRRKKKSRESYKKWRRSRRRERKGWCLPHHRQKGARVLMPDPILSSLSTSAEYSRLIFLLTRIDLMVILLVKFFEDVAQFAYHCINQHVWTYSIGYERRIVSGLGFMLFIIIYFVTKDKVKWIKKWIPNSHVFFYLFTFSPPSFVIWDNLVPELWYYWRIELVDAGAVAKSIWKILCTRTWLMEKLLFYSTPYH